MEKVWSRKQDSCNSKKCNFSILDKVELSTCAKLIFRLRLEKDRREKVKGKLSYVIEFTLLLKSLMLT